MLLSDISTKQEKLHFHTFQDRYSSIVIISMVRIAAVFLCFVLMVKFTAAGKIYNVVDYQAVGDGITDDAQAILKAWNAACVDPNTPALLIPLGKKFLIGSAISFQGPCKAAIIFQIDGNITAPDRIWTTKEINLISFNNIKNLNVLGEGTIDGKGTVWWDCSQKNSCIRPYLLNFDGCDNLAVRNVTLMNGPRRHLAFHSCTNLTVTGITITAPGDSPNTDGINIEGSQNIEITESTFAIGDDCIAISSGTSNVSISKVTCGPSHGISIGSLGEGGTKAAVEQIHVFDCDISHSLTGVRIKTWKGGSGYVRDVIFERINIISVDTPIDINQFYTDSSLVPLEDAVAISNVTFINIHGTSTQENAVMIGCSAAVPCTDLFFNNITLARDDGNKTILANVQNAFGTSEGTIIPAIPLSQKHRGN